MFYVFPKAIKPDVCEQIVEDCKQNILVNASIKVCSQDGTIVSRNDPEIRKTSINFIDIEKRASHHSTIQSHDVNKLVWHFLREANKIQFNYDLTYFQPIQFGEYKDGGFYGWHRDDDGNAIDEPNEIRKLTAVLAVSNPDTFEGGELQFYTGDRPMEDMGEITGEQITNDIKAQGSVIVFDSRDWHRVTPVTKGVRHSIVCWAVGPNFK